MMLTVVIIISLLFVAPSGNTNPDMQQVTSSQSAVDMPKIEEGQSDSQ